ncbi:MAG: hypothetical protein A2086_06415 [Spirochaetes bacterium GWD1_27_9]|nr:MAG: hypothetical protein A2Z98_00305 [Spirochaetes bacterium GWB1_27_13]OHD27039.1 MAG: hypothetical protein A2Y34_18395 [Spirochaetes bacterium GWC1_27_15]OHD40602.1 MAG: hypothetical protein A2086_06415 [Spirochaetes bacterium GWD1_27_9]
MKNIYGPVNSRRLGYSLGVSIVPQKTCNFDCIYCELGAGQKKTAKPDYYITAEEIIEDLKYFFASFNGKLDFITITGYGEPTLNKNIAKIAKAIKTSYPQYKLTLLTNSSFLDIPEVIESYKYFDVIMPSLDAVSEKTFKAVDLPAENFTASKMVENIKILRKNFSGLLELEILFCDGINTSIEELLLLHKTVKELMPDKIWINTVVRGPAYSYAKPISNQLMESLKVFFGTAVKPDESKKGKIRLEELLEKLRSSPMDLETIKYYLDLNEREIEEILFQYEKKNIVKKEIYFGIIFYRGL